jgi:hypothetical protein
MAGKVRMQNNFLIIYEYFLVSLLSLDAGR